MLDFVSENEIFTHPGQDQMQVEVILASRHADLPDEKPLFTIRMRMPRIIWPECLTHRVFSRNARSSRAVPVKTMLLETTTIPFVPWHWGKNQSGMQAGAECNELVIPSHWIGDDGLTREEAWIHARDTSVEMAEAMMEAGYHKQIPNRLLEPFSWIDVLITSNDWDNFLWLRDHEDAEPHLQDLARLVKKAIDSAKIQELKPGEWHLPYITDEDRNAPSDWKDGPAVLRKISAARCARISYKPFNGNSSYEAELERYDLLVSSDRVHASPLEHQATPDKWLPEQEGMSGEWHSGSWLWPCRHGNLIGWIQARKLVPNEYHKGN